MPAYYGRSHIAVTFAGVTLSNVVAGQVRHSLSQGVAEARVVVRSMPGTGTYDDDVIITGGRTPSNVGLTRFTGYFRDRDDDLFPGMVTLRFVGELARAAEFENSDSPIPGMGGLSLLDLIGATYGADQDIVQAILQASGALFTGSDIDGTGRLMGNWNPAEWIWKAGTPTDPTRIQLYREQGQKGLDYIREVDRISAVTSGGGASGGFYTTYDTPTTPRRTLVGGHPSGSPDLTFTEGIDILRGSKFQRAFPVANAVLVKGYDRGLGTGPVAYSIQSSNTFMPSTRPILDSYSSPLIEWDTEANAAASSAFVSGAPGALGMSAETIALARLLDLNREVVTGSLTTYRDDLIVPGQVHLVQGPGGAPGRLGVGENLWCIANTVEWAVRGAVLVFRQRPEYVGGGLG